MEIWLKQGKKKLRLPVLPSNFEVEFSHSNTNVTITNLGEVNLIGNRNLRTIPISSFFPNQKYNFVQYKKFPAPYECVKLIESWAGDPVQLTITGTNINMQTTIESFSYGEQDGTGDVYYTIELKEYRKPKLVEKKKNTKVNKNTTKVETTQTKRSTKAVKSTTYTVKKGDNLCDIAQRLTGSSSNWRAIANQNGITNPKRLQVGQKLVIKV